MPAAQEATIADVMATAGAQISAATSVETRKNILLIMSMSLRYGVRSKDTPTKQAADHERRPTIVFYFATTDCFYWPDLPTCTTRLPGRMRLGDSDRSACLTTARSGITLGRIAVVACRRDG